MPPDIIGQTVLKVGAGVLGGLILSLVLKPIKKTEALETEKDKRLVESIKDLAADTKDLFRQVFTKMEKIEDKLIDRVDANKAEIAASKQEIAVVKNEVAVVSRSVESIAALKFSIEPKMPPNGGAKREPCG
jgi:hypothetical protein